MIRPFALILACLIGLGRSPAARAGDDCLSTADQTIVTLEGTLTVESHPHPNGQEMRPFVLALARPVCVSDVPTGGRAPPRRLERPTRIQLAGSFDVDQARSLVGRPVAVTGTLFEAETAWHVTPVLILAAQITSPQPNWSSPAQVARAFYEALSRADGLAAQTFLIEEKRDRGAFTIDGIRRYFAQMAAPLVVTRIAPADERTVMVEYQFGNARGLACANRATVVTTVRSGQRQIESIRAGKDECRRR